MQRILIILAPLIAGCLAGVGELSPQDESQVLELFHKVCAQNREEGADLGGYTVYCKSARDDFQETISHQVQIPQGPPKPTQIVFIQQPAVRYQHNILLTGSQGQPQQSKIYVLPQRATHQIAAHFNPGQIGTAKPVVYFLNNHPTGGQHEHPHPQLPPPAYGPPSTHLTHQEQHLEYPPPHSVVHHEQQYGLPLAEAQHPEFDANPAHLQSPHEHQLQHHQHEGYIYPHPSQQPIMLPSGVGGYA